MSSQPFAPVSAEELGKALAMRMILNVQCSGDTWNVLIYLLASLSPIVDCGVHYLDVMCQITESKPLSVPANYALHPEYS